jgi:hypothetical protein
MHESSKPLPSWQRFPKNLCLVILESDRHEGGQKGHSWMVILCTGEISISKSQECY